MVKGKFALLLLIAGMSITASAQTPQPDHYIFVFLNKNPEAEKISKDESDRIMEGHMANINKLASEKRLLAAGPFEGGGGIFVLNTQSRDEALMWLEADPGVKAKRWNLELLPFHIDQGGICAVTAPFEMVNYTFVRFKTLITKSTITTYAQTFNDHRNYIANLPAAQVIATGTFGDHDGSILIVNGQVDEQLLLDDPAVQEGLTEFEMKILYIARGSFCEKN